MEIGIADAILLKPGSLDQDEWAIMRIHSEKGYGMLKNIAFLEPTLAVVRHHHERWDATGYPAGLPGHAIPLVSRVFSIADSFDAMTTTRPYRPARSIEEARREIERSVGTLYDPDIVTRFLAIDVRHMQAIHKKNRIV